MNVFEIGQPEVASSVGFQRPKTEKKEDEGYFSLK